MRRVATGVLLVLLLIVGYLVADVADVVPGPFTAAPREAAVQLPSAPAATSPAAAASLSSTTAPVPSPARLAALLRPALARPAMGPNPSMVVLDAASGDSLLNLRGDRQAIPASTAKVLTGAAALSALGPTTQLPTRAVLTGPGRVSLVGGGDIFLGPGVDDPSRVVGRAGLTTLARRTAAALKAKGATRVTVSLDDMVFPGLGTGQRLAPGWDPGDIGAGFAAPVTALAINAGRLKNERYAARQTDPGIAAAKVFSAALAKAGIPVNPTTARARAPKAATTLATVWSAPISDVVEQVLQSSDNNGADVLARLVAIKHGVTPTGPGGGQAVLDEVATLGVPTGGLRLVDGSGLSKGSLLTARVLALTLQVAARQPKVSTLLTSMPIAGVTGTLSERFDETGQTRSRGLVRAKTGTLTGTSTLVGTVRDASGATLIFAVMSGVTPDAVGARKDIDDAITILAGCGCR